MSEPSNDKIKTQLEGAQALVDLARKRTEMSMKRTEMSMKRTELALKRTNLAVDRTKLAAERTYMNYERTLSVWVRTSLAVMVFGIAIDRLSLMLYELPTDQLTKSLVQFHHPSTVTGIILVAFSILMALFSGLRFIFLTRRYKNEDYSFIAIHKTWLPAVYAFMVVLFGGVLLVLMLWIF